MTTQPAKFTTTHWFSIPSYAWTKDQSPPSALLRSDCQDGVPFFGRDQELADILDWCHSDAPLALRVYSGDSGVGKNRLFAHVCGILNHSGESMTGGFLKDIEWKAEDALPLALNTNQLWVVDDAEVRSHAILRLLKLAQHTQGARIRVVLLTRQLGEWWQWLNQPKQGVESILGDKGSTQIKTLPPLMLNQQDRQQLFATTHVCFARMLKRKELELSHLYAGLDAFENMAMLQMAALVSLFPQYNTDPQLSLAKENVLDTMLVVERAFWCHGLKAQGFSQGLVDAINQAVSIICAASGVLCEDEALAIFSEIDSLRDLSEPQQRTIARWLNRCYGRRKWIDALYPDVWAQHIMDQTFSLGEFPAVFP